MTLGTRTAIHRAYARETQAMMIESFVKAATDIGYRTLHDGDIGVPEEDIEYTRRLTERNFTIKVYPNRGTLDEGPNGEDIIDWTEQ